MAKETAKVTRKTARGVVAGRTAAAGGDVAPATTTNATLLSTDPEAVAERAYAIYLEEGRPEGRQLEHWLRAESELKTRRSN